MITITESTGGNFKRDLPKQGNRIARLIGIIDLGVQKREYMGEVKSPVRQATFVFELPNDLMEYKGEQKPIQCWVNNVSLLGGHEKAKLTQITSALTPGRSVSDLRDLIEEVCMINIAHKVGKDGVTRARPIGFSPMPDIPGLTVPEQQIVSFVFDTEAPTEEGWRRVPNWVKGVIGEGFGKPERLVKFLYEVGEKQYGASPKTPQEEEEDDGIPF